MSIQNSYWEEHADAYLQENVFPGPNNIGIEYDLNDIKEPFEVPIFLMVQRCKVVSASALSALKLIDDDYSDDIFKAVAYATAHLEKSPFMAEFLQGYEDFKSDYKEFIFTCLGEFESLDELASFYKEGQNVLEAFCQEVRLFYQTVVDVLEFQQAEGDKLASGF